MPERSVRFMVYGPSVGEHYHDAMYGHFGRLRQGDVAVSPDILRDHPYGSTIVVNGRSYRVADVSYSSPGRPNVNTVEIWNGDPRYVESSGLRGTLGGASELPSASPGFGAMGRTLGSNEWQTSKGDRRFLPAQEGGSELSSPWDNYNEQTGAGSNTVSVADSATTVARPPGLETLGSILNSLSVSDPIGPSLDQVPFQGRPVVRPLGFTGDLPPLHDVQGNLVSYNPDRGGYVIDTPAAQVREYQTPMDNAAAPTLQEILDGTNRAAEPDRYISPSDPFISFPDFTLADRSNTSYQENSDPFINFDSSSPYNIPQLAPTEYGPYAQQEGSGVREATSGRPVSPIDDPNSDWSGVTPDAGSAFDGSTSSGSLGDAFSGANVSGDISAIDTLNYPSPGTPDWRDNASNSSTPSMNETALGAMNVIANNPSITGRPSRDLSGTHFDWGTGTYVRDRPPSGYPSVNSRGQIVGYSTSLGAKLGSQGNPMFGYGSITGQSYYNVGSGWAPIGGASSEIRWMENSGTGNYQASQTAANTIASIDPGRPNRVDTPDSGVNRFGTGAWQTVDAEGGYSPMSPLVNPMQNPINFPHGAIQQQQAGGG